MNAHATDLSCLSYLISFFLSFFFLLLLRDNYFFIIIKLTDFAVLCDDLWTAVFMAKASRFLHEKGVETYADT